MKKLSLALCVCVVTLVSSQCFAGDSRGNLESRLDAAATVIKQIQSIPASAIPNWIVSKAECVAVVPGYKKAAFIVGGSYGQGVVTCRTRHGWSAPAFIQLAGGSWGLQIGGKSTDLVMVAVNHKGLQDLLNSQFKIGGAASAAAGPVGRTAAADTNITLKSELLTYSRSQGIFAGINLNGTWVHQNTSDTQTFYGHDVSFHHILDGRVATPHSGGAGRFVRTVARYFNRVKS